jgi:hypothetical protein
MLGSFMSFQRNNLFIIAPLCVSSYHISCAVARILLYMSSLLLISVDSRQLSLTTTSHIIDIFAACVTCLSIGVTCPSQLPDSFLAGRGHLSVQKIKDVYVLEKKMSREFHDRPDERPDRRVTRNIRFVTK